MVSHCEWNFINILCKLFSFYWLYYFYHYTLITDSKKRIMLLRVRSYFQPGLLVLGILITKTYCKSAMSVILLKPILKLVLDHSKIYLLRCGVYYIFQPTYWIFTHTYNLWNLTLIFIFFILNKGTYLEEVTVNFYKIAVYNQIGGCIIGAILAKY